MIELRPSASPIWTKCALAPRLWQTAPEEQESDPAREGTCAAWVAEMALMGHVDTCSDLIGEAHENGWVVDAEMAHHVQGYVDKIRNRGGHIEAERFVRLNEFIAGTPDCFAIANGDTLFVDDLKYGFEIVEPTTPQIFIYGGAILKQTPGIEKVTLGIYQPRAVHSAGIHRTITMNVADFVTKVNEIIAAGWAAQREDAMATPGDHCRRCRAAASCFAVAHEVYHCHTRMLNGEQRQLTKEEIASEMAFIRTAEAMVKGRKDALEAEANARSSLGENIPGWHKEQGKGQRRWTASPMTVKAVTGVDPTAGKMVSPAQLEKMGASHEAVSRLTETPMTTPKWKPVPEGYYAALFGEGEV